MTKNPNVTPKKWHPFEPNKKTGKMEGGYLENTHDKNLAPNEHKIYKDGVEEYFFLAPELVELFESLEFRQVELVVSWLEQTTRIGQRTLTEFNPFWAIPAWTIDQLDALFQTKAGYLPVIDPARLFLSYLGTKITGKPQKLYKSMQEYKALAGKTQALARFMDMDKGTVDEILSMKPRKKIRIPIIGDPFDLLSLPSNIIEISTRAMEYQRSLELGKSQAEAIHNASHVTVNFLQRGTLKNSERARQSIASVMFLRSMGNIYWKVGRTLKERPGRTALVTAALAATASLALWHALAALDDDEREEYIDYLANLPIEQLIRYVHIPSPWFGGGYVTIRIPEPLGATIGMATMTTVARYRANEYKADEYVDGLLSALPYMPFESGKGSFPEDIGAGLGRTVLSFIPQFAKPGLEAYLNYKVYPELLPIVPQHLIDSADPRYQYSEYNSDVAKFVGNYLNWSPAKIDHFVKGYLGEVGRTVMNIPNYGKYVKRKNLLWQGLHSNVTRGRKWNQFYDAWKHTRRANFAISKGLATDEQNVTNVYLRSKLQSKLHESLTAIRDKFKDDEKFPEGVSVEMFKLMQESSDADYYDMPYGIAVFDVYTKMLRMQALLSKSGVIKGEVVFDDEFMDAAKQFKTKPQDSGNILRKNFKAHALSEWMELNGWDYQKAEREFERFEALFPTLVP